MLYTHQPQRQVIDGNVMEWRPAPGFAGGNELRWFLDQVAQTRSNLFHGGKYPFGAPDPTRDPLLLRHGMRYWTAASCPTLIAVEPDSRSHWTLPLDITTARGWAAASLEAKQTFSKTARRFLLECDDGAPAPGQFGAAMMAGRTAVWYLRHTLSGDPELREAVLARWIDSLLRPALSENPEGQQAFAFLYQFAPDHAIDSLLRMARDECVRHKHPFALRHIGPASDARLADVVADFIRTLSDPRRTASYGVSTAG